MISKANEGFQSVPAAAEVNWGGRLISCNAVPQPASSPQPHRILMIRPSALGDVCRSVPVLASLRRAFSDAEIDWVVQSEYSEVIESHPDLTTPVAFPRKELELALRKPAIARDAVGWLKKLRQRKYDLVFDLQGLGRSGLMTKATRAPRRIGFRDAREFSWLGYNVRHAPPPPHTHTVDRMLALLEAEGIEPVRDMRLYVSECDRDWWSERKPPHYAVLAPTSRWLSKRWPIERWRDLIEPLLVRGFESIVIIGAPGEENQVEPLCTLEAPFLMNLTGRCTIGQMMAVIEGAGLLIANDSAPLHMAVGLERPCLGLFGPTDPAIVGPYRKPHAALRIFRPKPGEIINYRDAKLEDRLMRVISAAAVIQRIDHLLALEARATAAKQTRPPGSNVIPRTEPEPVALYLASTSLRRRQLLEDAGLHAKVIAPDIDDGRLTPGVAEPRDRVLGLAYLKARRVADQLQSFGTRRGIVLAADTLCVHNGEALGQPRNEEDARRMLTAMRCRTHHTMTGVCLIDLKDNRRVLLHDEAAVRMGEISDRQLDEYLQSGEWRGKAGGYNLSERIAAGWQIECDGDPATVMGLPLRRLRPILDRLLGRSHVRQPCEAAQQSERAFS